MTIGAAAAPASTTPSSTISHLRNILCDDNHPSLALRFRALFSLKHLATNGDIDAIDAIAAAFSSDSALLKHELAYCLGQTNNPHSTPYLTNVLSNLSEDPMVRHEAAEALGALGSTNSIPLLRQYLHDEKEEVRQTCEIAIARIEWLEQQKQKHKDPNEIPVRGNAFLSIDPAPPTSDDAEEEGRSQPGGKVITQSTIDKLQKTLTDQSLPLFDRYRAMFRLRDIISSPSPTPNIEPLSIQALASGFTDPSALFRHEIAFVFGQLANSLSIPYLVPVAKDLNEHPMVRHEAVEALGSIGSDEVEGLLVELGRGEGDKERVVRESAVVALDMAEWERGGGFEYALIPGAEEGKAEDVHV